MSARTLRLPLRIAFLFLTSALASQASATSWSELSPQLILLRARTPAELGRFVNGVEEAGGHVSVVLVPSAAIVRAPAVALESAAVAPWVDRRFEASVGEDVASSLSKEHAGAARQWNEVLRLGDLSMPEGLHASGGGPPLRPDAGPRPVPLSPLGGAQRVLTSSRLPLGAEYYDTSEFLSGWVAIGVWLLEATGSTYDWTPAEEAQTLGGVAAGMDAWVLRGGPAAALTFFIESHVGVPVSGVPIENSMGMDAVWAHEALGNAGYTTGDAFERCFAYNNAIRDLYNTHWCTSIFIVDSDPSVNQGLFAGGGYAWAYFGGPWVYMARYCTWAYNWPNYWGVVPMHELGHIFMSTDEYDNFQQAGGYMNVMDTLSPLVQCVMNQNDSTVVCVPTRGQLGIGDVNGNGIYDPMDIQPLVAVSPSSPDPTAGPTIVAGGTASVQRKPNLNPISNYSPPHDMTIATIKSVEGKVGFDAYSPAIPVDGAFDEYSEAYSWTSGPLPDGTYTLFFRARTSVNTISGIARDTVTVSGSVVSAGDLPNLARILLSPPRPNPAAGPVSIDYRLGEASAVRLEVIDLAGRRVCTLVESPRLEAGPYSVAWDGRSESGGRAPDGIYWITGRAGNVQAVERVVLLR